MWLVARAMKSHKRLFQRQEVKDGREGDRDHNPGDDEIAGLADARFTVPETLDLLTPVLTTFRCSFLGLLRAAAWDQRRSAAQLGEDRYGGITEDGERRTGGYGVETSPCVLRHNRVNPVDEVRKSTSLLVLTTHEMAVRCRGVYPKKERNPPWVPV